MILAWLGYYTLNKTTGKKELSVLVGTATVKSTEKSS